MIIPMMTARDIRKTFRIFEERGHVIVPSAPITNHCQDPTLMFTSARHEPVQDVPGPPGTDPLELPIRNVMSWVSGKHNDLEEVGSIYHHTMFRNAGQLEFRGLLQGKEAIQWAWEAADQEYGLSGTDVTIL